MPVQRTDDVEAVLQNQVVDRRDGTGGGVLHGQHAECRPALIDRLKDVLKGFQAAKVGFRKELLRRLVAVGALDALIGDGDAVGRGHFARMGDFLAERLTAADDVVLQRTRQLHDIGEQQPCRRAVFAALLENTVEDLVLALLVENGDPVFLFIAADLLGAVHPALKEVDQLVVNFVDFDANLA